MGSARENLRGTTGSYRKLRGRASLSVHEVFAQGASARRTDAFVILRE